MFDAIENASPAELAAVFAHAIERLGQLGREAAEAIEAELKSDSYDRDHIEEGIGWIADLS